MTDSGPAPAPPPGHALDPVSGEAIELASYGLDELAQFRDRLGDLKRAIDSTLVAIDAEVSTRLDHENVRSAKAGDWELVTEAPLETVWNVHELGLALESLVAAGRIGKRAAAAALEAQPVEYKARARELKKLLGHADPVVVETIDACRHAEPRQRRRVTVTRTAPAQRRLSGAQGPQEGQA